MKLHIRFLFTQLSGVFVGLLCALFIVITAKYLWPNLVAKSHSDYLSAFVVGSLVVFLPLIAMIVWGKILVFLNILNEDEVKGYPWSKPWKD